MVLMIWSPSSLFVLERLLVLLGPFFVPALFLAPKLCLSLDFDADPCICTLILCSRQPIHEKWFSDESAETVQNMCVKVLWFQF